MTTIEYKRPSTGDPADPSRPPSPWPRVGVALTLVIVPLMLLALVLPPVKGKAADKKQDWVLGLAIATAIASAVAYFVPNALFPRARSTLPLIVFGTAVLLIANVMWNRSFLNYTRRVQYSREVFRRPMRNFHAPIYGRYDNAIARSPDGTGPPYSFATVPWVILASGAAIGWFAWMCRQPLERRWTPASFAVLMAFQLAMILLFALCEPPDPRKPHAAPMRLTLQLSGYSEFASDIPAFHGVRDTLATYVGKMPDLNWYGQHYPPANLIVLTIERQLGLPGMTKTLVCLLTALTVIPLYKLARELELDDAATSAALLLFAATTGVLIYPTINTTSLVLFPATLCLWMLVRALKTGDARAAAVLGLSYVFYLCFSFSASILGVLMALTTILGWWRGAFSIRNIVRTGVISLACVFASVALLYATTRFNLIACFATAVRGHQAQQGNEGFDDPMRWWLRSTGNIIAYLMSIVPLSILAVAGVWGMWGAKGSGAKPQAAEHAEEAPVRGAEPVVAAPTDVAPLDYARPMPPAHAAVAPAHAVARSLFLATVVTVPVAGFSGLFYVETERIWIFLTPAFALAAGFELHRRARDEGRWLIYLVLFLVIAISCTQEFFFQHYR